MAGETEGSREKHRERKALTHSEGLLVVGITREIFRSAQDEDMRPTKRKARGKSTAKGERLLQETGSNEPAEHDRLANFPAERLCVEFGWDGIYREVFFSTNSSSRIRVNRD